MDFIDRVQSFIEGKNDKPVQMKFLTLTEQEILKNTLRKKVYFRLSGGYVGAELKRAIIYQDAPDMITCFQIYYNEKYLTLTHQNILGTLLSLSISKDSIGDILPKQGVFFVLEEMKEYIYLEFNKINQTSITLEEIDGSKVFPEKELEEHRFTSESLRLDLIVSKITKLSRNEVADLLQKDLIKVNHLIERRATKKLQENDVISIRRYGRFELLDTSQTSRKGKIIVKYGKYI